MPEEDIWSAPAQAETNEGVSANPPAAPSEVETPTEVAVTEQATDVEKSANAEAVSETAPESEVSEAQGETSTANESEIKRQGRKLYFEVDKLGGEAVFNEARDIYTTLTNADLDAKTKLSKLYQAAPRAYEDIQKEVFYQFWDKPEQQDILDKERFGVSTAEIKQILAERGQVAPSPTPTQSQEPKPLPTVEELAQMSNEDVIELLKQAKSEAAIPETVQEKLRRLDELEKQFPQLESKMSSFAEQQEAIQQKEVVALGSEFVQEAMSPVVRMMEEAGLKVLPEDTPEEKAWKEEIWDTILTKTYNRVTSEPLAADIQTFIEKRDRSSAWSKMRLAQAKAELHASKLIPIYTSHRQKQRESQTSVLNQDRPPVIQGGQSTLGSTTPQLNGRDAWNDPLMEEKWKDIAAQVG